MKVLMLLLASAVDGGVVEAPTTSFTDVIYDACPEAPLTVDVSGAELKLDGGVQVLDVGSLLLGPQRAQRNACLMATCDAARAGYKKTLDGPSQPAWWVGWFSAGSLGIGLGIIIMTLWNTFAGGSK
jgi:hypothetical protein